MNLCEVRTTGKPARFHINGKRVSRAEWERVTDQAHSEGTLCCFSTRAKPITGGGVKRWNYSVISDNRQR